MAIIFFLAARANAQTDTNFVNFSGPAGGIAGPIVQATGAGATTGTVSVVTPSGRLNSNPQFVVTKQGSH